MAAETVVSQGLRMASAPLDDVPHRRRNASYPEALRNDPKHDVFLNQDTSLAHRPVQSPLPLCDAIIRPMPRNVKATADAR